MTPHLTFAPASDDEGVRQFQHTPHLTQRERLVRFSQGALPAFPLVYCMLSKIHSQHSAEEDIKEVT